MKKIMLILIISILGQVSSALTQIEYDEKKVVFKSLVSVHKLKCTVSIGQPDVPVEDRTFTELRGNYLIPGSHPSIEMDYRGAILLGCEVEILDKIKRDAMTGSYGHVSAIVTVTKRTAQLPRVVFGKCQRNYQEKIKIDLGQGIVLKTLKLVMLKPATGCN